MKWVYKSGENLQIITRQFADIAGSVNLHLSGFKQTALRNISQ